MVKVERLALIFIMGIAVFQMWNAYVFSVRSDEAYLFLKSSGLSWTQLSYAGFGETVLSLVSIFQDRSIVLRLPSIIFVTISAILIYKTAYSLGGRYSAWLSTALFIFIPAVNYSYTSMTPNSLLILFTAVSVYSMQRALNDGEDKFFSTAFIAAIAAFLTDFTGIVLIAAPLFFVLISKEKAKNRMFLLWHIISLLAVPAVFIADYLGYFSAVNKYPVLLSENVMENYVPYIIAAVPFLIVLFGIIFFKNELKENVEYVKVLYILSFISLILFILFFDFDVRNAGALSIPVVILFGLMFSKESRLLYGFIVILLLGCISIFSNVNSRTVLTPESMKSTKIYESMRNIEDLILPNGAIYSETPLLSSLMVYNAAYKPEACTPYSCTRDEGIYVGKTKNENLSNLFYDIKETGTYRMISAKSKPLQFYFYRVSGLKAADKEKNKDSVFSNEEK